MGRTKLALLAVLVSALAIGGVASATGGNDQGSGVRAWAQVDPNNGSPVFTRVSNFVAVSSPHVGVYCLRPRAGINVANSAPVATQEVNLSTAFGLVTVRRAGVDTALCQLNEVQVTTWDISSISSNPTAIGGVAFDVIVP